MSELPKPVCARPVVATPPPPKPVQQTNQQPTPKPVTIETLAYELREIRLFLSSRAECMRQTGRIWIICGVIIGGLGFLASTTFLGAFGCIAGLCLFVVGLGLQTTEHQTLD